MTEKTVALVPARLDSRRLPRKQLRSMDGRPMVSYLVDRMQNVPSIDEILIATTTRETDDPLKKWADDNDVGCYRGSLEDVLLRLTEAARSRDADIVVRANGDNPLLAPEATEAGLDALRDSGFEFVTGKNLFTGLPVGIGPGLITLETLERLNELVESPYHREHVTTYVFENHTDFDWGSIPVQESWRSRELSVTVDTAEEFDSVEQIVEALPDRRPGDWRIEDIIMKSTESGENL